jgi:flagellar protein FlgJ
MALDTTVAQTAVDFQGLSQLRYKAEQNKDEKETLKQVAGQFESLFINMMLKNMRQAKLAEGLFDSSQSNMYRDMADQQLAMDLSQRGGLGLQDVIMRQLSGNVDAASKPAVAGQSYSIDTVNSYVGLPAMQTKKTMSKQREDFEEIITTAPVKKLQEQLRPDFNFGSPEAFVQQLLPLAKQAADKLGVAPEALISQAALETGWGKHVIKHADGRSSFNLFNIKAHKHWDGDSALVGTVEYRNGVALNEQASFRSYSSYQQSFNDYVNFLQTQPRYQDALKQVDDPEKFIEALHKAGYATDPAYSEKVKRIMNGGTLAQFSQKAGYS